MGTWGGGWRVHSASLLLYAWFEIFHNVRQLSNEVVSKKHKSSCALCIDAKCSGWVLGGVLRDPTWRVCSILRHSLREGFGQAGAGLMGSL